jgi:predicted anti-sigma-YlaC factor YlaD
MECNKVDNLLSAYIDGELLSSDMNSIKEHLEKCQKCKLEYQSLLRIKNILSNLKEKELPKYFLNSLYTRINREGLNFPWRDKILRFINQRYTLIPVLTTAVMIFLLIVSFYVTDFFKKPDDISTHFYIKEHTRYAINQPFSESVYLAFANSEANVVLVSDEELGE